MDAAEVEVAAIKRRLEQSLNGGSPITRTLRQTDLARDDVLFVREPMIAVQRRARLGSELFWLEGGIELRRVELRELSPRRFLVVDPITNAANPVLRDISFAVTC